MTSEFRANPRESTAGFLPSLSYLLFSSNSICLIFRAHSYSLNSLLAFMFLMYSSFFSLEYCFSAYQRLPQHERSSRKNFLAVAIWFFFTVIMFGFTYQFAPFFSFAAAAPLYGVAFAASAIIFYVYIIYEPEECCNKCCNIYNAGENIWVFEENFEIIFDKV